MLLFRSHGNIPETALHVGRFQVSRLRVGPAERAWENLAETIRSRGNCESGRSEKALGVRRTPS